MGHPDAILFLRNSRGGVFQQSRLISTIDLRCPANSCFPIVILHRRLRRSTVRWWILKACAVVSEAEGRYFETTRQTGSSATRCADIRHSRIAFCRFVRGAALDEFSVPDALSRSGLELSWMDCCVFHRDGDWVVGAAKMGAPVGLRTCHCNSCRICNRVVSESIAHDVIDSLGGLSIRSNDHCARNSPKKLAVVKMVTDR